MAELVADQLAVELHLRAEQPLSIYSAAVRLLLYRIPGLQLPPTTERHYGARLRNAGGLRHFNRAANHSGRRVLFAVVFATVVLLFATEDFVELYSAHLFGRVASWRPNAFIVDSARLPEDVRFALKFVDYNASEEKYFGHLIRRTSRTTSDIIRKAEKPSRRRGFV